MKKMYIFCFNTLNYDGINSINKFASLRSQRDNPVCSIFLLNITMQLLTHVFKNKG